MYLFIYNTCVSFVRSFVQLFALAFIHLAFVNAVVRRLVHSYIRSAFISVLSFSFYSIPPFSLSSCLRSFICSFIYIYSLGRGRSAMSVSSQNALRVNVNDANAARTPISQQRIYVSYETATIASSS